MKPKATISRLLALIMALCLLTLAVCFSGGAPANSVTEPSTSKITEPQPPLVVADTETNQP